MSSSPGSTTDAQADDQNERRQAAIGATKRVIEAARVALEAGDDAGADDLLDAIKAPNESLQASVAVLKSRIAEARRANRWPASPRDVAGEYDGLPGAAAVVPEPVDAPDSLAAVLVVAASRESDEVEPAASAVVGAGSGVAESAAELPLFQYTGAQRARTFSPALLAGILLMAAVAVVVFLLR